MISFEEAFDLVLNQSLDFGVDSIPLIDSVGRVLREDWLTDRDLPPYHRVTMDGIAFKHSENVKKGSLLNIVGLAAAGSSQMVLSGSSNCLEVMTGAILPKGADTIIRYEDLTIQDGRVTINSDFQKHQNIHKKGEDRLRGDIVAKKGIKLSTPEIGIGASIGKSFVQVAALPQTLIISTGDELVDIDKKPEAHQIRRSNSHQIQAILNEYNIDAYASHLDDDYDLILNTLRKAIEDYELIILSGGVSMGKFDYIPKALESLGVKKHFHKVKQRPGKPFWFGQHNNNCTFFALPGNPVSSFMCAQVYLKGWLDKSLGFEKQEQPYAILDQDVFFKPDLTFFQEVKLSYSNIGQLFATPFKGNGSGDLANLGNADAFIRLPTERDLFNKGEAFPVHLYRI